MARAAFGIELGVSRLRSQTVLKALKSFRRMFELTPEPTFEQVEPRMLLATAHFVSAVTDNTSLAVVIDYAGVDPATLGTGDITFTTAGAQPLPQPTPVPSRTFPTAHSA